MSHVNPPNYENFSCVLVVLTNSLLLRDDKLVCHNNRFITDTMNVIALSEFDYVPSEELKLKVTKHTTQKRHTHSIKKILTLVG